ncbi:hypothetical protein DL96DRAFT_1598038 [Flagelloscypha sp. PMI_526]|nr:hypothetical protein DL96DRAFT_1598038 [Flagelloscypha sp. PMI_526]
MLDGRHVKVYFEPDVHGQQARPIPPACPKSLHWDGDFAAFDLVTSYYELQGLERLSLALTSPATQIQCFSIFERFTMLKSCSIDHIAPGDEDQLWGKRERLPLLKRLKIRTSVSPMVLLLAIELPSLATLEVQVEKGCGTRALAGLQTGLTEARRNTGSILPEQELIVRSCDWDEQHVGEALWREFNQLCDVPRPSSASNDSSLTWVLNAHD